MAQSVDPILLDSTGQDMVTALNAIANKTVDSALSTTSVNPVQNKVITGEINGIKEKIPSGASSSNKMATANDITGVQNGVIANTKLIKDTVGWSGKNKAIPQEGYALDGNDSTGFRIAISGTDSLCYIAKVENGKSYIVSREAGNRFRIVGFKSYPTTTARESTARDIYNGSGAENTYTFTNTENWAYIVFLVNYDSSFDYSTAHGMVRDADILDDTFEPYFGSTAFPRSEQAVLGAKNLLPYPYPNNPSLPSGLFSADGAFIIADGTASGGDKALQLSGRNDDSATIKLKKGKYILSGNPNTDGSTYIQAFTTKNGSFLELALTSSATEIGFSVTDDILVSGKDYAPIGIIIGVKNNKTVDNAIFKPMLRFAFDPDDTYAPYAMTNRGLTEKVTLKKIAESAGNQTWGEQLTALNTTYSTLNGAEKLNTFIAVNDNANDGLYRMFVPSVGVFGNISMFTDGTTIINTLRLGNQNASSKTINTSGSVTVTNLTNETNSNKLILYSKG